MDGKTIQLLAAILGLVGSVILAVSLNRVLFEVRFAIDALATSIETVVSKRDVYIFRGLDERLKKQVVYQIRGFVQASIACQPPQCWRHGASMLPNPTLQRDCAKARNPLALR
jgi:hypothetical protein